MDAIDRGLDATLAGTQRLFLYVPLEHSRGLRHAGAVARPVREPDDARAMHAAKTHHATIARFGRFPARKRGARPRVDGRGADVPRAASATGLIRSGRRRDACAAPGMTVGQVRTTAEEFLSQRPGLVAHRDTRRAACNSGTTRSTTSSERLRHHRERQVEAVDAGALPATRSASSATSPGEPTKTGLRPPSPTNCAASRTVQLARRGRRSRTTPARCGPRRSRGTR